MRPVNLWRRTLDVVFAAAALAVLLPILVPIAIAIIWDSGRPVFFRQIRAGKDGKPFYIWKFRTMVCHHQGAPITSPSDERTTAVGSFLRRFKLDELPQFWNVLRGEMSVVGPRPEVPELMALYPAALRSALLPAKPGITGLSSLVFRNESAAIARSAKPVREAYLTEIVPRKGAIEADYLTRQSWWYDLKIIAATALYTVDPSTRMRTLLFHLLNLSEEEYLG